MDIGNIIAIVVSILTAVSLFMKVRSDGANNTTELERLRAGLSVTVTDQAQAWLKTQGVLIEELRNENTELRGRIEELEKKYKKNDDNLTAYIEYLLSGIRVLIRQVIERDDCMPEFDPVSLADFLLGSIG